jgi:hypothetical protein
MTKREVFDRIRNVRYELDSAQFALAHVIRFVGSDLKTLQQAGRAGISPSELLRCRDNLEVNYILRLFSEFEAALRTYWISQVRNTQPNMETLMDRIADRVSMAPEPLAAAHEIRDYRNDIIHQNPRALAYTYGDSAKALGTYLGWLPQNW